MTDNYSRRGTGCTSELHDWPLPTRLRAATDAVQARLESGWTRSACPDCGLHGWIASDDQPPNTHPFHEPYEES